MNSKNFFNRFVLIMSLVCMAGSVSIVWAKADEADLFRFNRTEEESAVVKVTASDMIVLENGQRIKLLGVESFGPPARRRIIYDEKGRPVEDQEIEPTISLEEQAIAYAQNLMEGKKIKLEYDTESRDDRGYKIAYVYLPDGRMANVELLRQGFVRLKIRPPNMKHENELKKAYQEARKEQRGFLSD